MIFFFKSSTSSPPKPPRSPDICYYWHATNIRTLLIMKIVTATAHRFTTTHIRRPPASYSPPSALPSTVSTAEDDAHVSRPLLYITPFIKDRPRYPKGQF